MQDDKANHWEEQRPSLSRAALKSILETHSPRPTVHVRYTSPFSFLLLTKFFEMEAMPLPFMLSTAYPRATGALPRPSSNWFE